MMLPEGSLVIMAAGVFLHFVFTMETLEKKKEQLKNQNKKPATNKPTKYPKPTQQDQRPQSTKTSSQK